MKHLFIAIAMMMAAATATAQSEQTGKQADKQAMEQRRAEMAQKRTDMMVKKYGLDEKQAAQLLDLNKHPMAGMRMGGQRGMRQGKPEGDKKVRPDSAQTRKPRPQGDFRKAMEEYEQKLQGIMTPEQYKAYKADREKMMKRGGQGQRGGFGQKRGGFGQRGGHGFGEKAE